IINLNLTAKTLVGVTTVIMTIVPMQVQTIMPHNNHHLMNNQHNKLHLKQNKHNNLNNQLHLTKVQHNLHLTKMQAVNPSSGAAGKYQFLQSTWDSVAPSEYQGQSPTEAPENVQDQAAQKLYDEVGPSQWATA
ncbi:transglycosylase family protein, partial [Staphylococcus nepalensis]|nr:transglycosylase family protein [Staphylococcus nepalensis]MBO1236033.1 transglycosylase family protein [Staphylococcus nepalensis]